MNSSVYGFMENHLADLATLTDTSKTQLLFRLLRLPQPNSNFRHVRYRLVKLSKDIYILPFHRRKQGNSGTLLNSRFMDNILAYLGPSYSGIYIWQTEPK